MKSADPNRHARKCALFLAAADLDDAARRALLDEACAGDAELRDDIEHMLHASRRAADPDSPFADARLRAVRAQLEEMASSPQDARARVGGLAGIDPAVAVDRTVGRYHIVRHIATGGMGVVYEATQEAPQRRVALKLIPAHRATPERLRRFRQEAELLGRLQHPGIAQIYEAGTFDLGDGMQPFFAMEYVDGVDVRTYADRAGLDVRARLALVAEIADAVHHAHERGIVHRDLKPDNVFVNEHGRAKVLDFGVARTVETPTAVSMVVTHEGQIIGTLAYMAPEQLSANPDLVTSRADVYALGVLLYELLTGRLPQDLAGLPTTAAIRVLTEGRAPLIGRSHAELKGDVETIVSTALEKDAARRYGSAAALASDLRRHLDDHPISARPPSRTYLARKFVRRHRSLVGGVAATMVTLLIGIVVAGVLASLAIDQRNTAAQREAEALRNEITMVGAQLQAAQSLIDAGRSWDARQPHLAVPERRRGWCWEVIGRAVPVVIDVDVPPGKRGVDPAWRFFDHDHLIRFNSAQDALEIYDLAERRIERTLAAGMGLQGGRFCIARDARQLHFLTRDSGVVLDFDRGDVIERWPIERAVLGDLSADGRVVIRAGLAGNQTEVQVDGHVVRRVDGDQTASVSEDGRLLSVFGPNEIKVTDLQRDVVVFQQATSRPIPTRAFNGGAMLVRLREQLVERIDFERSDYRRTELQVGRGSMLRVTPDGRFMSLAGGGRQFPTLLDARTGAPWLASHLQDEAGNLVEHAAGWSVELAPDAARLLVVYNGYQRSSVVELDPHERAPDFDPRYTTMAGHTSMASRIAISHDGTLVASASTEDKFVRVWDALTGEAISTLELPDPIRRPHGFLAFTPDDERVVMTLYDADWEPSQVSWDLATGIVDMTPITPDTGAPRSVRLLDAFIDAAQPTDHDQLSTRVQMHGDTAVVVGPNSMSDQSAPLEAGGRRWRQAPHATADMEDAVGVSVDSSGGRVAIAYRRRHSEHAPAASRADEGLLVIVDVDTGVEIVRQELGHRPHCCAYSPDGRLLAIGTNDGHVLIYETELHTLRARLRPRVENGLVSALAWTPDGTRLVTASGDTNLRVWEGRSAIRTRQALDAWRERRAALASGPAIETTYSTLTGEDRAAARVERLRTWGPRWVIPTE